MSLAVPENLYRIPTEDFQFLKMLFGEGPLFWLIVLRRSESLRQTTYANNEMYRAMREPLKNHCGGSLGQQRRIALEYAFGWEDSEEGFDFWFGLSTKLPLRDPEDLEREFRLGHFLSLALLAIKPLEEIPRQGSPILLDDPRRIRIGRGKG